MNAIINKCVDAKGPRKTGLFQFGFQQTENVVIEFQQSAGHIRGRSEARRDAGGNSLVMMRLRVIGLELAAHVIDQSGKPAQLQAVFAHLELD